MTSKNLMTDTVGPAAEERLAAPEAATGEARAEDLAGASAKTESSIVGSRPVKSSAMQAAAIWTGTIQSMTSELRQVMVCSPRAAGWDGAEQAARWRDLGFHRSPEFAVAQSQHDVLCRLLAEAGAEVISLEAEGISDLAADGREMGAPDERRRPAAESRFSTADVLADAPADGLTLDAVYVHDASLPTDHGVVLMRPGKPNRIAETRAHGERCRALGMRLLGEVTAPGCAEAGDIVWLDRSTLLVGQGYRTNRAGIDQLRTLLSPHGIEAISAPLPYGSGPSACLHLMSLMSMLDDQTILVDLPWLAVETVEVLKDRGFRFVEIDPAERDTLACNVLSLGRRRLIAIDVNSATNERLRAAGFDVRTFPGSEICINGNGGPTCLTRPLLRG